CRRQVTMAICPGSTLDTSSSVGAPSAFARSEGDQEAMNGTAANAAPTAPVTTVAVVRNLRRLRSTSSSATTTFSDINHSPAGHLRAAYRALLAAREKRAHACSIRLAGGGALYTNE